MTVEPTHFILTPEEKLHFICSQEDEERFSSLKELFVRDSSLGLLHLGLMSFQEYIPPSLIFWRDFSRTFIVAVCQVTPLDSREIPSIPLPCDAVWEDFMGQLPFMKGIEYLHSGLLKKFWHELELSLRKELEAFSGLVKEYLEQYRMGWSLVGRVCFHLAENKGSETHPFAFVATYTTQLSATSQVQHLPLKRALQQSKTDPVFLLSLLTPVQKAAQSSPFVKQLVDSGAIFEASYWGIQQAHQFLQASPIMESSGLVVRIPNWWASEKSQRVVAKVDMGRAVSMLGKDTLLDFDVQLAIGDHILTEEEREALQKADDPLVKLRGQWVEVDREKLQLVLEHWNQIKQKNKNGLSMAEALRQIAGVSEFESKELAQWSHVQASDWLEKSLQSLRHYERTSCEKPADLQGQLRPYQFKGLQWLQTLYQFHLGGCLADDMGLGKTIQVLSLLLSIKEKGGDKKQHLLIVPASLIGNWQAEASKFAPSLKLAIAHSSVREADFSSADLVITTYGFIQRLEKLHQMSWDMVILDEAQAIKNPTTLQTRAVKSLKSRVRLAMTGTPVENALSDLWSIFDFIFPGLLGSDKVFSNYVKKAQKSELDGAYGRLLASIRRLTQPYILRRLKSDKNIIDDLPDKTQLKSYCSLSREQVLLYQKTIQELEIQLEIAEGIKRRGLILSTLMRLKQICNHPDLIKGFGSYEESQSGKMKRLREICESIASRQERVLVFTQFTEIMSVLADFLAKIFGTEGLMLHGSTPVKKRSELVKAFQSDEGPPFFILSLKAGGTGLNLTKASHVIHFDRWWNPAVENQATDRAYRIGQKHPVMVHAFICRGTIEEKIDATIDSKKQISHDLLEGGGELQVTELSNDQIIKMVSLDIHRAFTQE